MPTDGTGTARVERKLAAILAADIAGYSALMGADEARTVRDLKGHQAVRAPMIGQHGGRIIDTAGDGILAEFGSVVNAVECAVAIQKTMAERDATIEADRQMRFRIGITLGDVIHDEARVYGDGVNIAARLEGIAAPGGICISATAYEHVHKKLAITFTDLGDQQLKNIEQQVRVYRIDCGPVPNISQPRPALSLPEKPSIAVLPFTNLSGDPKEDYFSDGITEDIITELSRFSELFVIARNSSFTYKGKAVDVRQVGRELGVRYVLEGSIRRAGDRVRITAQLIDAATGAHRWAERYDRELKDVFAVQDEVARKIVTILAAHIIKAETARVLLKPPATWEAYDYYLQAAAVFNTFLSTREAKAIHTVRDLLQRCISKDAHYSRAYALLSYSYLVLAINPVDENFLKDAVFSSARRYATKALQLDPYSPYAHAQLGNVLTWQRQHDEAIAAFERAIALNPNFSDRRFGEALIFAGEFERAIDVIEGHMRLNPFYPPSAPGFLGFAYYMLQRYPEAVMRLRECISRAPRFLLARSALAATYARMDQLGEARAEMAEALRVGPGFAVAATRFLFKHSKDGEHYYEGLRKAGLEK